MEHPFKTGFWVTLGVMAASAILTVPVLIISGMVVSKQGKSFAAYAKDEQEKRAPLDNSQLTQPKATEHMR